MLLLDPIAPLQDDDGVFVEDEDLTILEEDDEIFFPSLDPFDSTDVALRVTLLLLWMTVLEEEEGLLLLDPIASLQDDEAVFFLELLDTSAGSVPFCELLLLKTTVFDEEESSSFTDVLLSSPQAVNEIKDERLKTRDKVAKNCFIGYPPQIKYTKFGQ